ncbi:MAG: DUF2849 domain-containing protein [Spirochaetaceae bacterium]|nr:DUF2849 domain-containing protein [Myxococcales bacterium]MCB9722810.1 DUF2849 domain-containing protein [Spirochaetaceae bacterium]HPG27916.1 DUF2849 domain-containing protein [Myxococcota bacterium]
MGQVVIASRLSDGRVVFVAKASEGAAVEWALELDAACVAGDDASAEAMLALAERDARAQQTVVEPYLIDVENKDGRLVPTKYREAIRCLGPTIRPDLGKQAEGPSA